MTVSSHLWGSAILRAYQSHIWHKGNFLEGSKEQRQSYLRHHSSRSGCPDGNSAHININIATSSKQQIGGRREWRETWRERHGKDEETKDILSVSFQWTGRHLPGGTHLDFLHCCRCLGDTDLASPERHHVYCQKACWSAKINTWKEKKDNIGLVTSLIQRLLQRCQ